MNMSYIMLRYQLFIAVSNSDSTSEPYTRTGAVIGGAVGGAIILLISFVFCMMVYSVSWSCKKISNQKHPRCKKSSGQELKQTLLKKT